MLQKHLRNLRKTIFGYRYDLCICCIIKDENDYLSEWMNYHLKIGVKHFFIYDNESSIDIADTLKKLHLQQYATVIPISGKSMQMKAYQHFLKNFKMLSQWAAFIDTDEFIVPKSTKGDLPLFLKDYERYGGLGINWLIFGSSGLINKTNQSQLSSFTLRSDVTFSTNRHIKSIVQTKHVRWIDNPHYVIYKKGYFCVNENLQRVDGPFSDTSVEKIQINHYYCRSLEEYQEKIKRGRSDDGDIKRRLEDFKRHDEPSNCIKDTAICEIYDCR
ncbi:glycosyltransferase family 2 protein [Mucilaginibacter sp. Bleaf8]|uniref:glycosyltransferase family 2 protein n=1 Tax=Mucilaginibacter sp. Bleaf8 TaxID=2834430 RepID=UPI001BCF1ECF|nr:glycosyltransferase family 2 protein [Mucilaginibacter sp. Bleaf8]MBS7563481.1 glycosyltransferase family 2 protein [Mucilaginibacter sp. Bleaf8]